MALSDCCYAGAILLCLHCTTHLSIAGTHSPAPPSPKGLQSQPSTKILRITQWHFLPPLFIHMLDKECSSAVALALHFFMNSLARWKEKLLMCLAAKWKPKEREGRKLSFCTTAMQILTSGEASVPAASTQSQSWEIKYSVTDCRAWNCTLPQKYRYFLPIVCLNRKTQDTRNISNNLSKWVSNPGGPLPNYTVNRFWGKVYHWIKKSLVP